MGKKRKGKKESEEPQDARGAIKRASESQSDRDRKRCRTVKKEWELRVISHAGVTLQHHGVGKVAR